MHDVKNRLFVVLGSLELAQAFLPAASPARQELHQAREALMAAVDMLQRRLRDQPAASPQPLDLRQLLLDSQPLLRRLVGSEIDLAITFPPEPVPVFAQAEAIQGVLLDLAHNAARAMPQGGKLSFELGSEGQQALLLIKDTGSGMEACRSDGSGQGLRSVALAMRAHNGSVSFESAPGQGTSVRLALPLYH